MLKRSPKPSFSVSVVLMGGNNWGIGWYVWVSAIALTVGLGRPGFAQQIFPQATNEARIEQLQEHTDRITAESFDLRHHPVEDANRDYWRTLLWTIAILEPQDAFVEDALSNLLAYGQYTGLSDGQTAIVQAAMQVSTQLYQHNPQQFDQLGDRFLALINTSPNPEWVAMSLSALVQSSSTPEKRQQWRDRVLQRFPDGAGNLYLNTTLQDLAFHNNPGAMPPLGDLLNTSIAPGEPQLYVLCSSDRGQLCRAVFKDSTGQFVREGENLWSVLLSLRSLHELPWNFTRGETPQGVYRVEGVRSPTAETFRAYGQFPRINLFLPGEDGVEAFIPGQPGTLAGGLQGYQALLPPSWQNYWPIQQAYWAGQLGRSLFRIHGSGESTAFFANNRHYLASADWNPAIGCLSALERYDETGQLVQADMPKILDAFATPEQKPFTGYVIVVEVADAFNQPVTLDEIEPLITANQPVNATLP